MRTDDGSIIYECLNGEPGAFGVLVDKYKEGIYAFVYTKLRNFQDAQDVGSFQLVQGKPLDHQHRLLGAVVLGHGVGVFQLAEGGVRVGDGEGADGLDPQLPHQGHHRGGVQAAGKEHPQGHVGDEPPAVDDDLTLGPPFHASSEILEAGAVAVGAGSLAQEAVHALQHRLAAGLGAAGAREGDAAARLAETLPEGALLADGYSRTTFVRGLDRSFEGRSLDHDTMKVGRLLKTSRRIATELDDILAAQRLSSTTP